MSGIHVLSEIPKGGNKLEKTSKPKGKGVSDSPENVAEVFTVMFSGLMNSNVDPKGQNSKAGEEPEEKKSTDNPSQSVQNPNGQESMLGYGNFVLSNLFQPMLQSDLPAGKEANSGNDVSQGTEGLATANASLTNAHIVTNNNMELALLDLASLVSDGVSAQSGMTTSKPQGANPGITELDKYRQVIANLLVALSGKITEPISKGTGLSLENGGTMDFRQEMTKIVQGWMTVTDDAAKGWQSGNPGVDGQAATLLAQLNHILSQGVKDSKMPQGVNETTLDAEGSMMDSVAKGSSDPVMKQSKGMGTDLSSALTAEKGTALYTIVQRKSEGMFPQKWDSTQSVELSEVKDALNNVGIVPTSSQVVYTNVTDGKTVTVPVWEQISTVFSEQVMNRHQELKELDIQLHPADLGKIQIGIRWENGQVHLIVHASEATTGQLLQNQLSDLRQNLTNHGVNCGLLQMGQGGERQRNPRGDESQETFNQNSDSGEDEDLIPVSNPLSLRMNEINGINVTA